MITYTEQLRKPKWQERRLRIMERDNFSCVQCGDTENELQIHHKIYIPGLEAWEYSDDLLITLCKKCHGKENKREKHEEYLIYSLRQRGFTAFEILSLSCLIDKYSGFRNDLKKLINNAINLNL